MIVGKAKPVFWVFLPTKNNTTCIFNPNPVLKKIITILGVLANTKNVPKMKKTPSQHTIILKISIRRCLSSHHRNLLTKKKTFIHEVKAKLWQKEQNLLFPQTAEGKQIKSRIQLSNDKKRNRLRKGGQSGIFQVHVIWQVIDITNGSFDNIHLPCWLTWDVWLLSFALIIRFKPDSYQTKFLF